MAIIVLAKSSINSMHRVVLVGYSECNQTRGYPRESILLLKNPNAENLPAVLIIRVLLGQEATDAKRKEGVFLLTSATK